MNTEAEVNYPECINKLYQSEVPGEQAFLALPAIARNEPVSLPAVL